MQVAPPALPNPGRTITTMTIATRYRDLTIYNVAAPMETSRQHPTSGEAGASGTAKVLTTMLGVHTSGVIMHAAGSSATNVN